MHNGSQVAIVGRILTRSYDDTDGKKCYVTEVVADNVQFLDSKGSRDASVPTSAPEPTPYDFASQPEPKTTDGKNDPFADFGNNIEISDDDLPF